METSHFKKALSLFLAVKLFLKVYKLPRATNMQAVQRLLLKKTLMQTDIFSQAGQQKTLPISKTESLIFITMYIL